jgi:uncharacterized membrane protein YebE (DUF533 family)
MMSLGTWFKSEVEYTRDLADSGWNGARAAWESLSQEKPVGEVLTHSARASVAPSVMCAGLGALCALMVQRKRNRAAALALGIAGGFVGFTAALAWETRELSSEVARGAMREMSTTRDSHWLVRHPINFG